MCMRKNIVIFVNMSDNEDLLGDDLGDHSLADYNLGNDEEDQLLADDYESSGPQNVPTSVRPDYTDPTDLGPVEYGSNQFQGPYPVEAECVVPNITVEVPVMPTREVMQRPTYAPYEPPVYDTEAAIVPPPILAGPVEPSQIVPSEAASPIISSPPPPRARFVSERGAARAPVVRDIPDTLDKVYIPGRGRTSWRNPQYTAPPRQLHPAGQPRYMHYRRRGNFTQRNPPPQIRAPPPQMRAPSPQMRPDIRPDMTPDRPDIPGMRPPPQMEIPPERPIMQPPFRQERPRFPNQPRFINPQFRPNMEDTRPNFNMIRPNFDRPQFQYRPNFQRPFGPIREVIPNSMNHMPQVTIRNPMPNPNMSMPVMLPAIPGTSPPRMEPEVRMLPVQLPPNLPPGGLAGKKVLINPHFKGNFQPPVEGLPLPAYIPTRIQKSPPLSPTLESKFGPIKDLDAAAERFIAEQRNVLARKRTAQRRSPQRYIENTVIEIENELAPRRDKDDDLLRRQEEFINANRAGLRRRMRSPSPARTSPSPPRREPRRREPPGDEDTEYKRRLREQESLRERVLRAKEVRRRRNAVALQKQIQERDRAKQDPPKESKEPEKPVTEQMKPDTTRTSPERDIPSEVTERDRSPLRDESAEVNSTCENLTPPRDTMPAKPPSPDRDLTPPLPEPKEKKMDSDDELDLILDDIDDILSDDDDSGRFKEKAKKAATSKPKPVDLRVKLPPKEKKAQRQKIVFHDQKEEKRKDKSPVRKAPTISSSKDDDVTDKKAVKSKPKPEAEKMERNTGRSRQRIVFDNKTEKEKERTDLTPPKTQPQPISNRRVILQRKVTQPEKSVFSRIEIKNDPTKPNPGIFSRAVRTAISNENTANSQSARFESAANSQSARFESAANSQSARNARIVIKKDEPQIEYESESDLDEDLLLEESLVAEVVNLPHGMTDTRLKTLAGSDVQSLILDKQERSAKITFKTSSGAESFKKKFNNKMVAASRLTVTLR